MLTESLIRNVVKGQGDVLRRLALRIHDNPELGFQERKACAWQVALLRKWGFSVKTPFSGLPTAYRASLGSGRPQFCLMAEYDALPNIGHACGHNLICAAALGAGLAVARALRQEKRAGTVVVMGTPAEESKGGKVKLVADGALKGIDACLMAHPSYRTTPDMGSTAIQRFSVTYRGQSAHAAAAPEKARNALDAVMLLFQGVNAWRQQMPETSRIHGVVLDGGAMPNIIPDRASCVFYLRSPDDRVVEAMVSRFRDIARGAALMTATEMRMEPWLVPYKARRPNAAINAAYVAAARAAGLDPVVPERSGRGSSDFGDVSHVVPGAHVYFGVARREIAGHSPEFARAARSDYGLSQMLKAAEAMALTGWRYFSDPAFRVTIKKDFQAACTGGRVRKS